MPYSLDPLRPGIRQRIEISSAGCWLWTGYLSPGGYAHIRPGGSRPARMGHRVVYEALVGPIPEGLTLDHLCRTRPCLNPEHMEPVTQRVNNLRGNTVNARHAAATECPQGHPYDEENTYTDPRGRRGCRECQRVIARRKYRKARAAEGHEVTPGVSWVPLDDRCFRGHQMTPESLGVTPGGKRYCRTCRAITGAAYYWRTRGAKGREPGEGED